MTFVGCVVLFFFVFISFCLWSSLKRTRSFEFFALVDFPHYCAMLNRLSRILTRTCCTYLSVSMYVYARKCFPKWRSRSVEMLTRKLNTCLLYVLYWLLNFLNVLRIFSTFPYFALVFTIHIIYRILAPVPNILQFS